jgi:hypothetical protein
MYKKILFIQVIYFLPFTLPAQQNAVDSSQSKWSFSTSGYYYFIPNDKNTFTLIGYADHKAWHLEARYNYEDRNTASVFAGLRFETGGKLQFGATPMVGIAFGNTNGVIPALELDATYKIFDFYSESEYLVNFSGKESNFFYVWSELAVSPVDAPRTGISIQRTRLYQTAFDTQRGIFAEYSFWKLTAGTFYFNPFSSENFVILSLSMDF